MNDKKQRYYEGTHKQSRTRLYRIWASMKTRCYNSNHMYYKNYGGRGITVCDEWRRDFVSFMRWAQEAGYDDSLSIDRIDNDKGYCPENCRWATLSQQMRNTRISHRITASGETRTLAEWSEITGLRQTTIRGRLRRGWAPEEAISIAATTHGYHHVKKTQNKPVNRCKRILVSGHYASIAETARRYGVSYTALCHRLRRGESPQDVVDALIEKSR